MKDRIPGEGKEGLVILTPVDETKHLYRMERADDPIEPGNPLNKATLLTDEACRLYGYDNTAVPDDIFKAIAPHVVATIAVTGPPGATVSISNGERTITAETSDEMHISDTESAWSFSVQAGIWTANVERGYDKASAVISVTEVRNYTVRLLLENIYGVSWEGDDPDAAKWIRTDNAAVYPPPSPATGNGGGSSPFDDLMPWAGMLRYTDDSGNELVAIPKFWYKWTFSGTVMKLQIADYAAEGFCVSPAHAKRHDNDTERDVIYVGRYHCNLNGKSVTKSTPAHTITLASAANKLSGEYHMMDYATYWTICMLYLVEFANWNSQTAIGYGCSANGTAVYASGDTDEMGYHTGIVGASRGQAGAGATQYRYIEDLWGNVMDWITGIHSASSTFVLWAGMTALFSNAGAGYQGRLSNSGFSPGGFIRSWGDASAVEGFEFAIYPNANNGETNSYVRDYVSNEARATYASRLAVGGWYAKSNKSGLFRQKWREDGSYPDTGYRMVYLPGYSA